MNIEPLHLPPEESRAFGTAGADPSLSTTSPHNHTHHHVTGGGGMGVSGLSSSSSSSSHLDTSTSTSSMRLQYESSSAEETTRSQTTLSTQPTTGSRGVHPAVNTPNKYQESVLDEGDTGTATRGIFARAKAASGTSFCPTHLLYMTLTPCEGDTPLKQLPRTIRTNNNARSNQLINSTSSHIPLPIHQPIAIHIGTSLLNASHIPKPVGISIASFSRTKTPLQVPPPPPPISTTTSGSACTQSKPVKPNSLDF